MDKLHLTMKRFITAKFLNSF